MKFWFASEQTTHKINKGLACNPLAARLIEGTLHINDARVAMSIRRLQISLKQKLGEAAGLAHDHQQETAIKRPKAPLPARQLRVRRDAFYDFITLTEFFPRDIFQLAVIEKPAQRENKEARYLTNLRRRVFKHAGKFEEDRLLQMGLSSDQIAHLKKTGKAPRISAEELRLDMTLDHIIDRGLTGSNHVDNLIIAPHYINLVRNRLVLMQRHILPEEEQVLILDYAPTQKAHKVAVVFNGFNADIRDFDECRRRVSALFQGREFGHYPVTDSMTYKEPTL